MNLSIHVWAPATIGVVGVLGTACGGNANIWGRSTPTQIEGAVVASSFPGRPTAFVTEDEAGTTLRAPLSETGIFTLELPSQHHYRLSIDTDRGAVRIIFPRASDRIDRAFVLKTTQAHVALGSIRYIADPTAQPVVAAANECQDGTRSNGSGLCTVTTAHSECFDGYRSAEPATCSDLDVVLGYGTLSALSANAGAEGPFAVAAQSPPCEVQGCYVPDEPNPPQTPTN